MHSSNLTHKGILNLTVAMPVFFYDILEKGPPIERMCDFSKCSRQNLSKLNLNSLTYEESPIMFVYRYTRNLYTYLVSHRIIVQFKLVSTCIETLFKCHLCL